MSRTSRVALVGAASALGLGAIAALAPAATADPVNRNTSLSTVTCADGRTFQVTGSERSAQWSPGLDVDSTTVLVPVEWGDAHIELSDPEDGTLIAAFDEPWAATKGSGDQPGAVSCVVTNASVEDVPGHGETLVTVTIPVRLVVVGH